MPLVEERRGVLHELDPLAFGDPIEDQDQDEVLEARIPDCNIAPPQEGLQAPNPIQILDWEDDLPWVQEEDEGFYLQDEGGIPLAAPGEEGVYMLFEDREEYPVEEEHEGFAIPEDEELLPFGAPE